ncbi:MAG: ribosome recycling factor [Patescibacteria group bacterium]
MQYNFSPFKEKCAQAEEWLKKEFASIRTNRAAPSILDSINVPAYGGSMPINQVASVVGEGPRSLRITPWDMTVAKAIEKAIADSNLGLSVSLDEKGVRVNFPELTTERRTGLIKLAKQKLEDARVTLRQERDEMWEQIQADEKKGGMSEDEKFRFKNEMQKIIDDAGAKLEEAAARKEQEIMS